MKKITIPEKLYAVIGCPVSHSKSPQMQNAGFRKCGLNAEYIAVRVEKEDLEAFIKDARKKLAGFNITVPHKNNILPFLDHIDPTAALAESVNTVTVGENGTLTGYSTDGYGLERAVLESGGPALKDAVICFIGCGGVVPALAFHAASCGAQEIRIINRTTEKAVLLAEKLKVHHPQLSARSGSMDQAEEFFRSCDLIVQCTSLGLKEEDPAPVDPALLPDSAFFFDVIYKETAMLRYPKEHGIRCAGGALMLLYQGVRSFEIWTGVNAPAEAMREALFSAG